MMRIRLIGPIFVIFALSSFLFASCYKPTAGVSNFEPEQRGAQRLLVLPFQDSSQAYGENVSVRCRLCGQIFTTGLVQAQASGFLTQRLMEMLAKSNRYELVPASQAEGVISGLLQQHEKELPELELYRETGKSLHAKAVLIGKVYRFRQRDGTDYSVNRPASVAFHLDLIRVADGRVVWTGNFDETQQALSEDLFRIGAFFEHKGRWVTAEDLAAYGLRRTLETMPPL